MAAATRIRMSLEGDRAMRRKLERVAADQGLRKVARKATLEVGEDKVLIPSRERAPEKTGRLKRSGRVKVMVSSKKDDIRISILFGGPLAPYARIVHEKHPTKSKFLESVMLEAVRTLPRELAQRIDLRQAAG